MSVQDLEKKQTGNEIVCISFNKDQRLVNLLWRFFQKHDIVLKSFFAKDLESVHRGIAQFPVSFLATDLGSNYERGMSLSTVFGMKSVRFPPLIMMVDQKPNPEDMEFLRRQGVIKVVSQDWDPDEDAALLMGLVKSPSWLQVRTEFVSLQEVFGMIDRGTPRTMVDFSSAGEDYIWTDEWGKNSGQAVTGRVYIKQNEVVWCETPTTTGVEALAEMLAVEAGQVTVHREFLEPARGDTGKSIENFLIEAIEFNLDHQGEKPKGEQVINFDTLPKLGETDSFSENMFNSDPSSGFSVDDGAPKNRGDASEMTTGGNGMTSLNELLKSEMSLVGVARSDEEGNPLEQVGEIDGEMVCAISTMGNYKAQEISDALGLGNLKAWALGSEKLTLYSHISSDGLITGLGKRVKNPEGTLKKLSKHLL